MLPLLLNIFGQPRMLWPELATVLLKDVELCMTDHWAEQGNKTKHRTNHGTGTKHVTKHATEHVTCGDR